MLNDKLKRIRLERGYSQTWVSKKLGYKSSYTLYRKEKGKRSFSVDDIKKLCNLYCINANELLSIAGGAGNEENISESASTNDLCIELLEKLEQLEIEKEGQKLEIFTPSNFNINNIEQKLKMQILHKLLKLKVVFKFIQYKKVNLFKCRKTT
ncbi:TPA: helix-turn-helix transcriptional regulator [Clostridioides difficile]|nr:helix-turn-helix transcriptional regulator [Clostridioides difficile]